MPNIFINKLRLKFCVLNIQLRILCSYKCILVVLYLYRKYLCGTQAIRCLSCTTYIPVSTKTISAFSQYLSIFQEQVIFQLKFYYICRRERIKQVEGNTTMKTVYCPYAIVMFFVSSLPSAGALSLLFCLCNYYCTFSCFPNSQYL